MISVDVEGRGCGGVIVRRGELVQRITYPEGKRGPEGVAKTGMAERAGIETLLPGKVPGADDIFSGKAVGRMSSMPGNVLGAVAVAALTADRQHEHVPVIGDDAVVAGADVCRAGVTLHTFARNLLVEIHQVGRIAGTVAPCIGGSKPGDW